MIRTYTACVLLIEPFDWWPSPFRFHREYAPPKYDESVEKITESCSLNFYFWLFCQVYPDTVPRFLFWVSVFSGMQVLRTPLNETQANSSLVGILMTIGDVTDYL